MRNDRDSNTNTGTSELKAVASEALQLGKRGMHAAREWMNQRSAEISRRAQAKTGDEESGHGTQARAQQEGQQQDYQQHAQRGFGGSGRTGGTGFRSREEQGGPVYSGDATSHADSRDSYADNAGDSIRGQQPRHRDAAQADQAGGGTPDRPGSQRQEEYPRGGSYDAQADDREGSRYCGQYGAPGAGQGQGRPWESEYGGQPVSQYGGSGGSPDGAGTPQARPDKSSQNSGFRGRGPKGYSRPDQRITEDLCERLSDDDMIDATEISVSVKDGVASLTGTVHARWMKYRAEDLAEACGGVKEVDNQIRVQGSQASSPSSPSTAGAGAGGNGKPDPTSGSADASGPGSTSNSSASNSQGKAFSGASTSSAHADTDQEATKKDASRDGES